MTKDGRDWVRLQDAGPPATMPAERRRRGGPGRRVVLVGAGVLVVVIIAAGLWLASDVDEEEVAGGLPPLVAADTSPTKHRPEDPGGMEVPNQQMLVYERVSPNPAAPRVERLLPPPEQPVAKPAPPPLPAAPQSAAAPGGEGTAPGMAPPALPDVATADGSAAADEPPADMAAAEPSAEAAPAQPAPEVIVVEEQVEEPAAGAAAPEAAAADAPPTDDGAATAAADTPVPAQKPAMAVLAAKAVASVAPAAANAAPASAPAPRQAAVPPVVTAAAIANGFRIQLASFSNEAGAQTAWKKLASAHGGVLGKLKPVVVRVDLDGGVRYRLQAGSFADAESARRACSELKARKQDCLVVSDS